MLTNQFPETGAEVPENFAKIRFFRAATDNDLHRDQDKSGSENEKTRRKMPQIAQMKKR